MVVKESQRTFTYLNLYGYSVDAVVVNRLFPATIQDHYFDQWKAIQDRNWQLIEECFAPLPILRAPLFAEEIVGTRMLSQLADQLFRAQDPSAVLYPGRVQTVLKEDGRHILSLLLPLVSKDAIDLRQAGDELVVQVGNQRRNVALPRALAGLEVAEAKLVGDELRIFFK